MLLIIQFFSLFVKLKLQIKKIEQDFHDYHDLPGLGRDRSSGSPDPERVKRAAASFTVARGPVPRDHSTRAKNERKPTPFSRPRHGEGQALALRWKGGGLAYRSAGACPPRSHDLREKRTPTNALSSTEAQRGTGPRPTVTTLSSC